MPNVLYAIAWFVVLIASIVLVFKFVGFFTMTAVFPEGRRRWHFPVQLASLALFSVVVLNHPF
jgi:hypothetical protein